MASIGVYRQPDSLVLIVPALALYQFFFSFVLPLQTARIAAREVSGHMAVLVPVAQGLGVSLGRAVIGSVVEILSFALAVAACLIMLIASYGCVMVSGELTVTDDRD